MMELTEETAAKCHELMRRHESPHSEILDLKVIDIPGHPDAAAFGMINGHVTVTQVLLDALLKHGVEEIPPGIELTN